MTEPSQNYTDIIEQLKSKICILENENRLLKKRLCEAGISYVDEISEMCIRDRVYTARLAHNAYKI